MATQASDASGGFRVRGGVSDELAVLAQRAQAFTNASGTAIALSEGNAAEIICRARAGSSAPELGTPLRVEGTFTGLCIQSGKELRCDDSETDTRVDRTATRALGVRSMVVIPIKVEGRVVGVLAAFAPTAQAFTITHVAVLKTMADHVAAYLQRKQQPEEASPEPLPAPPVKAAAVSAAASASPAPAVVSKPVAPAPAVVSKPVAPAPAIVSKPVAPAPAVASKPMAPAPTPRRLPAVPKVEPVRAGTVAEETVPAPLSKKKRTNSHAEKKEPKTYFRAVFGTLDAAAEPERRLGANVLIIGAAALVITAVAVGFSFKLRRPTAAPQPALETSGSPGAPAAPAPASANAQPSAKNSPPAQPANRDDAQPEREEAPPKREKTVVLSARPSRISGARDDPAAASATPAVSLGSVPAAGSLSNLVGPVSQAARPRLLVRSELEPITVIKRVPPVYPLFAKQSRLSASVVVQGTVNKNGKISDLQLISGPPLFRDAAFAAVKQWVFKPARLNGQPIEQTTTIRLHFGVQ